MKLKINTNELLKVKIDSIEELSTSIFNKVYDQASILLEQIIENRETKSQNHSEPNNNVIAFNGERGTGKSSTMLSFAAALGKKDHKFFENKKLNNISNSNFYTLDVIDPSLFKGDDKLFETIISKMFFAFHNLLKKENSEINNEVKRDLITKFQIVFENLKTLHGGKNHVYGKESIEALFELSNGTNLKYNFQKLVKSFLNIFKVKNNYLVLLIDDFDLNITKTYDMLEDIRQFLIIPEVIILIACKKEQLIDSVSVELNKEFEVLLSKEEYPLTQLEIIKKSERYIDKLIPSSRIIDLPNLRAIDFEMMVVDLENNTKENDFQNIILDYLYIETGIFISKSDLNYNYFFPETLREFIHFLNLIDLSSDKVASLKDYILELIRRNFSEYEIYKDFEFVQNEILITKLLNFFEINFEHSYWDFREKYKEILASKNPRNISVGDLFFILDEFEKENFFASLAIKKQINFLKAYISIRLKMIGNTNNYKKIGSLYTEERSCFQKDKKSRRDWIKFDFNKLEIFKENKLDLYWIGFFINHFGTLSDKFRSESDYPYFKEINSSGGAFSIGTFSVFTPLSHILNEKEVWKSIIGGDIDVENQLYNEINYWKEQNKITLDLLYNPFFFNELIMYFDELSKNYKGVIGNTENALFLFFIENSKSVINKLNINYPFLKLDINLFVSMPVYKYWIDNRDRLASLLNTFLTQDILSLNPIDKLNGEKKFKNLINQYVMRIQNAVEKQRTIRNLINKLNVIDFENKKKIISQLEEYHYKMRTAKSRDELGTLTKEIVEKIINNFN